MVQYHLWMTFQIEVSYYQIGDNCSYNQSLLYSNMSIFCKQFLGEKGNPEIPHMELFMQRQHVYPVVSHMVITVLRLLLNQILSAGCYK